MLNEMTMQDKHVLGKSHKWFPCSAPTLLEEMVLFRTRNGSISHFIYGTPKWFYIEPFFLVKGSIGTLERTLEEPFFMTV